jgi:hypothetical protein
MRIKISIIRWLSLFFAPIVAAWVYGYEKFHLLTHADSMIYTGYSLRMPDLIAHWGYPYFGVRFGLILPSRITAELLGPVSGYLFLRWVLVVLCISAIFWFLKIRYRWEIGALTVCMILLSPIFIRAVMTVYSTTVIVPAVGTSFALILLPVKDQWRKPLHFIAGCFLGMAIHSNLFALPVLTTMLIPWLWNRWRIDRRGAFIASSMWTLGVLCITAIGVIWYAIEFGDADIFTPTISMADSLRSGDWPDQEKGLAWMNYRPEVWLAPISSLSLMLLLRSSRRDVQWFEWTIAWTPFTMWMFYVIDTFFLGGNGLQLYFYLSYLIIPVIIAFGSALGILVERISPSRQFFFFLAVAFIILLAPVFWSFIFEDVDIWSNSGVLPIGVGTLVLISISRYSKVASVFALVSICLMPFLFAVATPQSISKSTTSPTRHEAYYSELFFVDRDISLELYTTVSDFLSIVPQEKDNPGSVVFWTPTGDYFAALIQWSYLGPYSSLTTSYSAAFPNLNEGDLQHLRERTPRYLVVLSSVESNVEMGSRAVKSLGLPVVNSSNFIIQNNPYQFWITTFEFLPDACDLELQGVPLSWRQRALC